MEFKTSEVIKLFSLNRNTFQDWLDRELITPSIQKSTKQGESNIFSLDDLYRIYCFIQLMSFGLDRRVASKTSGIFKNYTKKKIAPIVPFHFYTISSTANSQGRKKVIHKRIWPSPDKFDWNKQRFGLVINLETIKAEVDTMLRKLRD